MKPDECRPAQPHEPTAGARPPRGSHRWAIIAAIAVVPVLVAGGAGAWLAMRGGYAGGGRAATVATSTVKTIAVQRLNGLLLTDPEINAVMGSSGMQPGKPITSMDTSPMTLSLPECQGALYTSQDLVYAQTGYAAVIGLVSSEPGDHYDHWVNQAVVSFPSADKARALLETSTKKWRACVGKMVTVTNKGKTYRWAFSPLTGDAATIAITETQEGAEGWACQRAMSVANNVVADINACGYTITDEGARIAGRIVAKVNETR